MTTELETFELTEGGRLDPAALDVVLRRVGACYLAHPALGGRALAELETVTADFFRQPPATKLAVQAEGGEKLGYRPPGTGAYGAADGSAARRDRCELFKIGRTGEPAAWAQEAPAMRAAWRAAYRRLEAVGVDTAAALAAAAGAVDPGIEGWMASHASNLAANWYAPEAAPDGEVATGPGALRGAHTDFGPFTLLHHPPGTPGLELEVDGAWVPVAPQPGRVLLLLGDMLAYATGDAWHAPRHRVTEPPLDQERLSVVFFMFPDPATEVRSPVDGVTVDAGVFVAERLKRVYAA